ncbi:MAG: ferrochelatase [Gammaproteobacteria bacterium]
MMSNPAIILVNLGTPTAPTTSAVKAFLAEFLHDKRVIPLTRFLWCPLLHFIILPWRSPRVAKLYQSIWWDEGSPLRVITERTTKALQAQNPDVAIYHAMRYGEPNLRDVLPHVASQNHSSIMVLPLYPQYSVTTTESVFDLLKALRPKLGATPIYTLKSYHAHPLYIEALAQSVEAHWAAKGRGQRLLLSFHGIPEEYHHAGDPYPNECRETARLLGHRLKLNEEAYQVTFQSRFGPKAWVKPYTVDVLKAWAAEGIDHVDVISPSFGADCLETLEELSHTLKADFLAAGGRHYHYIAALNDSPAHINLISALFQTSERILLDNV